MTGKSCDSDKLEEVIATTACLSHCGGACVLKVHVKDGVITRIETDDDPDPEKQLRACLKGRAQRQVTYSPERLLHPLKRVGPRGKGPFERISWDEALDTIARELKRVKETYGSEAILSVGGDGNQGFLHDSAYRINRLLNRFGGFTQTWGICSYEGGIFADLASYGVVPQPAPREDLHNSRLIVLWGYNPAESQGHTNTSWHLARIRESGVRIISIDPRCTETTAALADQWIPIRPGTDVAMLIAMAHVMITENLHDRPFLDKYTVGFELYKDYVLGSEDGVPKTPVWAEAITGVDASVIADLAREYALTKPAALLVGPGPGRVAYGEQFHRAAIVLASMVGCVGIPGGSTGGKCYGAASAGPWKLGWAPVLPRNPIKNEPGKGKKLRNRAAFHYGEGPIDNNLLTDAIMRGKAGGYPADFKFLYITMTNFVNQRANTNRIIRALNNLEFVVKEDLFMTITAKCADIVLPHCHLFERRDLSLGAAIPSFYGYKKKILEPMGESRPQLEIATELAKRLGIENFPETSDEEQIRWMVKGSHVKDFEAFKRDGICKIEYTPAQIPFAAQINDPANNPFPTPSGKIEIYSQLISEMENPLCPPIPKYIESWESRTDPLAAKYPLQLITPHRRRRSNAQFDNIPWLRETDPHAVEMNSVDAKARGIRSGDMVKVFNARGMVQIRARVTERILPGVVDVPQGAWYDPDENGVDRGGCANVLTNDVTTPGGAFPCNTALVQVEKA